MFPQNSLGLENIKAENTEKLESHVSLGKSLGDSEYVQQKGQVFFIFIQFCKHYKQMKRSVSFPRNNGSEFHEPSIQSILQPNYLVILLVKVAPFCYELSQSDTKKT